MSASVHADSWRPEEDGPTSQLSVPAGVPAAIDALANRLADELAAAWRQGDCRPSETFLAEHPELRNQPEAALRLIYEEVCIRQEMGRAPTLAEMSARFPYWAGELNALFECHRLFEPGPARPDFPEVGATLNDFRLVAELGRGAQGRVFLATQPILADRPVVLKLTPCTGGEHLSLARLQHAGIVPLYFAHEDRERNLRVLGMPYFGGLTLARLLEDLRKVPMPKRSAEHLIQALDQAQSGVPLTWTAKVPVRTFLGKKPTYVEAVCWIATCLAEALHFAHERGLIHMDVKPSNVLLSTDGQPMLLDFHLAQPPIAPDRAAPERVGGTLAYMPREQQAAMSAVNTGQPITVAVDRRADIYSLGALLYEALGGTVPVLPGVSPPLCRINPLVSVGLSDIVNKCLAYDKLDRYPTADALAADLFRHLRHQPLRGVPNRSWSERWLKWRTRRPHALRYYVGSLVVAAAVLVAGLLAWRYQEDQHQKREDNLRRAQMALREGKESLLRKEYAPALDGFQRGLGSLKGLPDATDLHQQLAAQARLAEWLQHAGQLKRFVEEIRYQFVGTDRPRRLEAMCRDLWKYRYLLSYVGAELPRDTPPAVRADWQTAAGRVPLDLLDIVLIRSSLHVAVAEGDAETRRACRESLDILDEAEKAFGRPSPALERERLARAEALGDQRRARASAEQLRRMKPATAWEYFLLGRSLHGAKKPIEAEMALEQSIHRDPHSFWPYFYSAWCAYEGGRYRDAVERFSVCIALTGKPAVCYFNRGLAHKELKHADDALGDFQQALKHGFDADRAHYQIALTHLNLRNDRAAALASLKQALTVNAEHRDAKRMKRQLEEGP
jgi:serine/threonine protein kinase